MYFSEFSSINKKRFTDYVNKQMQMHLSVIVVQLGYEANTMKYHKINSNVFYVFFLNHFFYRFDLYVRS